MLETFWRGVAIGIGGTILMDIWALILWKLAGQKAPNWGPAGRWFWHLGSGKVFHEDIGRASAVAGEQSIGWVFHYSVGIVYGLALALFMGPAWLAEPTFLPAWSGAS